MKKFTLFFILFMANCSHRPTLLQGETPHANPQSQVNAEFEKIRKVTQEKKYESAHAEWQKWIQDHGANAHYIEAQYWFGLSAFQLNHLTEANNAVNVVLTSAVHNPELLKKAYLLKDDVLYKQKSFDQCLVLLFEAIEKLQKDPGFLVRQVRAHQALEEMDKAHSLLGELHEYAQAVTSVEASWVSEWISTELHFFENKCSSSGLTSTVFQEQQAIDQLQVYYNCLKPLLRLRCFWEAHHFDAAQKQQWEQHYRDLLLKPKKFFENLPLNATFAKYPEKTKLYISERALFLKNQTENAFTFFTQTCSSGDKNKGI